MKPMFKFGWRSALLAAVWTAIAGVGVAPAQQASGDTVVARVNGKAITENDLKVAADEIGDQIGNMPGDPRSNLIDALVNIRLAAIAAAAAGLDKAPEVAARLELVKNRELYVEYLRSKIVPELTNAAIHKRFDEELAKFVPGEEIHVRHILVKTEDEAKAIIAELDHGGDFAAIAKEKSIDTGSATNGGDLEFIAHGDTVKEFEDAAFALDVGQYTKTPVQTKYGWHVIKVEEKRQQQPPTFEQEAQRIRSDLFAEDFDKAIAELRAAATIEIVPAPSATTPEAAPAGNQ